MNGVSREMCYNTYVCMEHDLTLAILLFYFHYFVRTVTCSPKSGGEKCWWDLPLMLGSTTQQHQICDVVLHHAGNSRYIYEIVLAD